jgi:hypothetical protein
MRDALGRLNSELYPPLNETGFQLRSKGPTAFPSLIDGLRRTKDGRSESYYVPLPAVEDNAAEAKKNGEKSDKAEKEDKGDKAEKGDKVSKEAQAAADEEEEEEETADEEAAGKTNGKAKAKAKAKANGKKKKPSKGAKR